MRFMIDANGQGVPVDDEDPRGVFDDGGPLQAKAYRHGRGGEAMSLPAPWARRARWLAESATRAAYYKRVRYLAGLPAEPRGIAAIVAHLALPWEGLCIPLGAHSDEAAVEDYWRHRTTLGEVVPHLWRHATAEPSATPEPPAAAAPPQR
jgi:hypothetical protein